MVVSSALALSKGPEGERVQCLLPCLGGVRAPLCVEAVPWSLSSSRRVLPVCVSVQMSPFYKDTSHTGWRPTWMTLFLLNCYIFPGGSVGKHPPVMQETHVRSLDQKDLLQKGMATHSSVFVLKFPWTEEPGGLQSMGLQRIGDDLATKQQTTKNYICNNPISKQDHILRYWG